MWGIEFNLTSVQGSELTGFSCGVRQILFFGVSIEIFLVFVWRHRNLLGVRVGIELTWLQ